MFLTTEAKMEQPNLLREYSSNGSIKVVQGDGSGFFGKNSNRMARHAQGKWLCFLNNDTVLQPKWLDRLLSYAEKNPSVQIIGNIQVYDDMETVNHAGIAFDHQKHPPSVRRNVCSYPWDTKKSFGAGGHGSMLHDCLSLLSCPQRI